MGSFPILDLEEKSGWFWITFSDLSDVSNALQIEKTIQSAVKSGKTKIVADFSHINELYSSGMGLLIRLRKTLTDHKGMLCLVNVNARVREAIGTANLDRLFPTYATDVEFEISQEDVWQRKMAEKNPDFIYVAKIEDGIWRIILSGFMTAVNDLSPLENKVFSKEADKYLLDLTGLEAMDSMGIGLMVRIIRHVNKNGYQIAAFGVSDLIQDLLTMISIDDLLPVFKDEKAALNYINGKE